MTYGSLFMGLFAVIAAGSTDSWNIAGGLLALCTLLDTFDGRYAGSFTRSEDRKAFGIELDSLADGVVFGFVPIVCLYLLTDFEGSPLAAFLWMAASMTYLVCALTRLGCYNLHQSEDDSFTGVPSTLAALVLSVVFLGHPSAAVSAAVLFVLAFLMVLSINIPRPRGIAMLAFITSILLVVILHVVGAL